MCHAVWWASDEIQLTAPRDALESSLVDKRGASPLDRTLVAWRPAALRPGPQDNHPCAWNMCVLTHWNMCVLAHWNMRALMISWGQRRPTGES